MTRFRSCYVPCCFALWYALNVAYNITNKWALVGAQEIVGANTSKSSALPFTIGCIQFGIGALYACVLWILRLRPVPHAEELSTIATSVRKFCTARIARMFRTNHFPAAPPHTPQHYASMDSPLHNASKDQPISPVSIRNTFHIAIHHTFGQLCTILSLSSNSISFAHVIKAMEPFFSAIATRVVLGQTMDFRVYLSLIPVVGGVVMACAGSKEFSWFSFWSGMGSNAFFAMRGVVSKIVMEGERQHRLNAFKRHVSDAIDSEEFSGTANETTHHESDSGHEKEHTSTASSMSPANLFAAVTCMSFLLSIPLALIFEGDILREMRRTRHAQNDESYGRIPMYIILSGLFHYLNNEVMYLVLSNVHPITLAVGNTMKRVFIIVAGLLVFSTPVSLQTAIGSVIGIGGVFLYSLARQWYASGTGNSSGVCSVKGR